MGFQRPLKSRFKGLLNLEDTPYLWERLCNVCGKLINEGGMVAFAYPLHACALNSDFFVCQKHKVPIFRAASVNPVSNGVAAVDRLNDCRAAQAFCKCFLRARTVYFGKVFGAFPARFYAELAKHQAGFRL